MGLFNFDKNKILGAVFQTASNVLNTASRAFGSAAKTAKKVSTASSNIGKTPIVQPTAKPVAPAPVAPIQVTEGEPDLGKPISPGSSKPMAPVAPEPLTADAGTIAKLMAEIEKLKKERDFLLQAQQANSKPFGAASVSANAASFEQQMDVAAAIDSKRAANPQGDDKELRQQAIDEYYYPEDEEGGYPDDIDELAGIEPGPIPF